MAAITNFIITPLSFLSGTFYSVENLPQWFRVLTHLNPVFYLIDGVRYGVIGQSDSSPWLGLAVVSSVTAGVIFLGLGPVPARHETQNLTTRHYDRAVRQGGTGFPPSPRGLLTLAPFWRDPALGSSVNHIR